MINNKRILTGLEHYQYEHPFDRAALEKLQAIPFLTKACEWVTSNFVERVYNIQYTGSHLKITKQNYPQIYRYLENTCRILDLKKIPELYMAWDYSINACTIGAENPIIILNSGLVDLCDDDEIMFILGHECGHIKSNHMLYHMMAQLLNWGIDSIPGGSLIASGLQFSIYYWNRMSEFTADRAGLLCCQNQDAMIRAFIKMAGLPLNQFDNIRPESFIQQARDFKMLDYDGMNKVVKFLSIADETHPWTVMRSAELIKWIDNGEYNRFVHNNYIG
ncbi:MAG: M48 family metallopeptidase [Bacteroidaceae bacterium]|nr:M48 family metallopeptidase [Bacteroidaceae bacterium]